MTVSRPGDAAGPSPAPGHPRRRPLPRWAKVAAVLVVLVVLALVAAANLATGQRERQRARQAADRAAAATAAIEAENAADAAVQPAVANVRVRPRAVVFGLTVHNSSRREVSVTALGAEGLTLRAAGLPQLVRPRRDATLEVVLTIESCVHLPGPLDTQRTDSLPFAAFELQLAGPRGAASARSYLTLPGGALYIAVRDLAARICGRDPLHVNHPSP